MRNKLKTSLLHRMYFKNSRVIFKHQKEDFSVVFYFFKEKFKRKSSVGLHST